MSFDLFTSTPHAAQADAHAHECFAGDAPARLQCRTKRAEPRVIFIMALFVGLFGSVSGFSATGNTKPAAQVTAASLKDQIVAELHGVSIAEASAADLVAAVRKVVARNPKEASAVVAEVLAVERPDWMNLAGLIVAAAIEGLGPDISDAALVSIVRVGLELQRPAILTIVHCSARAVSSCDMVSLIVDTASHIRDGAPTDGKESKEIVHKEIVQTEAKQVVPADNKETTPLQRDPKEVQAPTGKEVVAPAVDPLAEQIAQTALEARPDCFGGSASVTNPQLPYPTPKPILPINPSPQPTPPVPSSFPGVIKSPAHIDPYPVTPSR